MKENDKITVIVPIYNAENYLCKCVGSIISQTHVNLQVILVDDGSVDASLNICKQLQEMDSRIEIYHTENKGSVAARKYGLERARGTYIGFVDADDYVEPEMFAELLHLLRWIDADFVHTGYVEEGGTKAIICDFEEEVAEFFDISEKIHFIQKYLLKEGDRSLVSPSLVTKLYKAAFIKNCFLHLPDEQQYGEDLLCLWRCILESRRIVLHRSAMYHYVVRKNSLSHMPYEDYMIKEIGLWHHLLKVMAEYQCLKTLKEDIYIFFKRRMVTVLQADKKNDIRIPHYYWKNIEKLSGKRIVIYGAGDVGQDYYAQISKYKSCEILAWVDSDWRKYHFDYAKVTEKNEVNYISCDVIIIAVRDRETGMEIRKLLKDKGVPSNKVKWQEPGCYY